MILLVPMQYTTHNPSGDLIISNYHNLQTTNYVNTSISNSNDDTVFIDPGCCSLLNRKVTHMIQRLHIQNVPVPTANSLEKTG